ncbi:MAG: YraN family protein [Phycisphaerales bacterium]
MLQRLLDLASVLRRGRSAVHLGRAGEAVAAKSLRRAGFRVIGRNLHVPMGEADLLCLAPDRRTIVLVEVKTRAIARGEQTAFLPPEAAITAQKRARLGAILRHLQRANRWTNRPVRIDVVAVDWPVGGKPVVRHHADAVSVR